MAFNFYGTFTTGQFSKLRVFSQIQLQDIEKRILWLQRERIRMGVFTTEYNGINPSKFTVTAGSYAAKLFIAYKALGGIPEEEMLLRTLDMPVYLMKGTPLTNNPSDTQGGFSVEFSNGRTDRGNIRFDRSVGMYVDALKKWQLESIKRKRESLEYKIKRALDYSDELAKEIELLESLKTDTKDLDSLISFIIGQAFRPGAMNIVQNVTDFFGLRIGYISDFTNEADLQQKGAQELRTQGGSKNQSL